MKRAFVLVYEMANAEVGLTLAKEGPGRGFDIIMWSPYFLPNTLETAERAIACRSVYIHETTPAGGLADIWTPLSGWLSSKPARLPVHCEADGSSLGWKDALGAFERLRGADSEALLLSVRRNADAAQRRVAFCEDILVRLGVDTVVLPDDNIERDSFTWIAAAHRRNIPVNVLTYGTLAPNLFENAYRDSPEHRLTTQEAEILKQHLPQWLREGDDYAISRLPIAELLGREMAGLAVANPWLVNTGHIDVIALDSESVRLAYETHGFAPDRLSAVGHPFHDRLHSVASQRAEVRATLAATLGLDPHRPWLVAAVPPNQSHRRPVGDLADFGGVLEAFCRLPETMNGWQILVSPHPNIVGTDLQQLRSVAAHLVEAPVAEILPIADAYLASVSTTIKWALALGIPVIDFDCYQYRYPDYVEEPGVRTVHSRGELMKALEELNTPTLYSDWQARTRERAPFWGRIDGKAMDRIVDILFHSRCTAPVAEKAT